MTRPFLKVSNMTSHRFPFHILTTQAEHGIGACFFTMCPCHTSLPEFTSHLSSNLCLLPHKRLSSLLYLAKLYSSFNSKVMFDQLTPCEVSVSSTDLDRALPAESLCILINCIYIFLSHLQALTPPPHHPIPGLVPCTMETFKTLYSYFHLCFR